MFKKFLSAFTSKNQKNAFLVKSEEEIPQKESVLIEPIPSELASSQPVENIVEEKKIYNNFCVENKHQQLKVRNHLQKFGQIDSWTAIEKYGITRLSAYIFNLRKKGYVIYSEKQIGLNKEGKSSRFVKYFLLENKD